MTTPTTPHGTKREPALECRIRRMVKDVQRNASAHKFDAIPEVAIIIDRKQPLLKRIVWAITLLLCTTLCLYLLSVRVLHYLSDPVSVRVIKKSSILGTKISALTMSPQSLAFSLLRKKYDVNITDYGIDCVNPILGLLEKYKTNDSKATEWNIDDIWNASNVTKWEMQVRSRCRFENVGIHCKQEENGVTVNVSEGFTYFGKYTRLDIEITKEFHELVIELTSFSFHVENCGISPLMTSTESFDTPIGISNFMYFAEYKEYFTSIEFKHYQFLNRKSKPCVPSNEYHRCVDDCRAKRYYRILNCRLPFIPEQAKLPKCNLSEQTKDVYEQSLEAQREPFQDKHCPKPCGNPCDTTTRYFKAFCVGSSPNKTSGSLLFSPYLLTDFVEIPAYSFVDLLSDIGGILGLCLGLCVLSLIEILHFMLTELVTASKPNFAKSDPMYCTVRKVFDKYKVDSSTSKEFEFRAFCKSLSLKHVILCLISLGSIIETCFFVHDRLSLYLTWPTRNLVEITTALNVDYPFIMDCGEGLKMVTLKKRFAKKKRIRDWCKVDMLDLLGNGTSSATKLWKSSIHDKEFLSMDKHLETSGFLSDAPEGNETVYLPTGSCVKFRVGSHRYIGTFSCFYTLTSARTLESFAPCEKDFRSVYILPEDEDMLDLVKSEVYYSYSRLALTLRKNKVEYSNKPNRPCVSAEKFLKCRSDCFKTKLRLAVTCSLPFFPAMNLSECRTSTDAKKVRNSYLMIVSTLDPIKECNCDRRCQKTIYDALAYIDKIDESYSVNMAVYVFMSSMVETIREEQAYFLSGVLCDIGGNLGLTLGFSVLSFLKIIERVSFALKTIKQKNKKMLPK